MLQSELDKRNNPCLQEQRALRATSKHDAFCVRLTALCIVASQLDVFFLSFRLKDHVQSLWEIVGQTQPPLFLCNKSSKSSGPPHPPPSFLKSKSSKSSGPPHPPPSFLKSKSSKSSGQYRLFWKVRVVRVVANTVFFFASEKSRVVRVVRVVE